MGFQRPCVALTSKGKTTDDMLNSCTFKCLHSRIPLILTTSNSQFCQASSIDMIDRKSSWSLSRGNVTLRSNPSVSSALDEISCSFVESSSLISPRQHGTFNSLTVTRHAIVRKHVSMGSGICRAIAAPAIDSSLELFSFRALELFFPPTRSCIAIPGHVAKIWEFSSAGGPTWTCVQGGS